MNNLMKPSKLIYTLVIIAILCDKVYSYKSMIRPRSSLGVVTRLASGAESGNNNAQNDEKNNGENLSKGIIPTGKELQNEAMGASALSRQAALNMRPGDMTLIGGKPPSEKAKKYAAMVQKLTPNEMLLKFAQKSPKNVQEAAKSTVMHILGQLPNYALDAALITTSSKLANLIYQMQLTGYMLKNAEYRYSLTKSLKGMPRLPESSVLQQGNFSTMARDVGNSNSISVSGDVTITDERTGDQATFDANEFASSLSKEVIALREELSLIRGEREKELQSNLLTYVQALPEQDLIKLSSGMSEDVMEAFSILVDALMEKLQISESGPEMAVQQSMSAVAQLCMWQLTVGYKLREIESFETGDFFDDS